MTPIALMSDGNLEATVYVLYDDGSSWLLRFRDYGPLQYIQRFKETLYISGYLV
jgi:hypothetical protein